MRVTVSVRSGSFSSIKKKVQLDFNSIFVHDFYSGFPLDPRIPVDHKVILHFGDDNQLNNNRVLHFQSPLVKLEPLNAVAKYNSLERFDDGE